MKRIIFTTLVTMLTLLGLKEAIAESSADGSLKDSQIMNILVNLNNSEITTGKLAKQNARDDSVKSFADEMIDGHSKANIKIKKLSKDLSLKVQSDPISEKMKRDSNQKISQLKKDRISLFDSDYMDAQVAGHQDAIKMLDEKLIPNAKSPQLISMLNQTKTEVQSHLDLALKVRDALKR